jgi:SAM-dependent methyltransferase
LIKSIEEKFPARHSKELKALDVGCGTGISTRALFDRGWTQICGLDVSEGMLEKAKEFARQASGQSVDEKRYWKGDVSEISRIFGEETFDVITAFSAFHWFCTPKAIGALKSSLAEGGVLAIAEGGLEKRRTKETLELWALIESLQGKPVHDPREGFDPIGSLKAQGFYVDVHSFPVEESYTLEEAIKRKMSFSGWCNLTDEQKEKGLPLLRKLLQKQILEQNHPDGKLHEMKIQVLLMAWIP